MSSSEDTCDRNTGALKVSLIIPMRNEEQSIARLVQSINKQVRPPDEIILVDGGSTDRTVEMAHILTAKDGRYRIIEAGPATPGRGRNVGCQAAQFDWFAFTDAGIELQTNWLYELVKAAESDPKTEVIYGNFEPVQDSFFTRCAAMTYVPMRTPVNGLLLRDPVLPSTLLRRNVMAAIGGFADLRACEDHIMMNAILDKEFKVVRAPKAEVWWSLQPNLWRTFERFRIYSFHNVAAGRLHDWHLGVARNYILIAGILIAAYVWVPQLAWLALLLQAARAAKYIFQRRRGLSLLAVFNPAQYSLVFVIVTVIDIATFAGWIKAWGRWPVNKILASR